LKQAVPSLMKENPLLAYTIPFKISTNTLLADYSFTSSFTSTNYILLNMYYYINLYISLLYLILIYNILYLGLFPYSYINNIFNICPNSIPAS